MTKTRQHVLLEALSSIDKLALRRLVLQHTPSERNIVTSHLRDAEHELEDCEIQIAILLARRERLLRQVERSKSLLSPINSLPPELLCSGFEHHCERNALRPDGIPAVSAVSQVSHGWRRIVLSSPRLWSSIHIDFSWWKTDFSNYKLPRIARLFMKRSDTVPLRIKLSGGASSSSLYIMEPTLEILTAHSTRWLELDSSDAHPCIVRNDIFAAVRERVPNLTYLNAGTSEIPWPRVDMPSLSSVIYSPSQDLYMNLPLKQLTDLRMTTSFAQHAVPQLQRCSRVETLELTDIGGYVGTDDPSHNLQTKMPVLKTLKVTTGDSSDALFPFRHLILPQMTCLKISIGRPHPEKSSWPMWDEKPMIQTFFHQSPCITTLHLQNLPASDSQVLAMLSLTPMLQDLLIGDIGQQTFDLGYRWIVNRTVTTSFLRRLLATDSNPAVIIPRLTYLTLHAQLDRFDTVSLIDMAASRLNPSIAGVVSLKTVEVQLRGHGDLPRDFALMKPLKDAGLGVKVSKCRNTS
ncbi:hypothetical protein VNI00_013169 [Paramarasmius palmivorus]|uniref:F-box domain-containing protein n=1 Tax=Paramarasmius palmivorus TaxID=297713 RepID=A0AAW0BYM5_9AGAR